MYYNLINSMSRGAVALDADVINFLNANLITDTTYINALNTMVLGLKEDGLYDGIQCWHIFYGNGTQSKFNFKNPIDSDSGFRLIFFGGGTISNNGFLTNGTNAYAKTHFVPITNQATNSNGITLVSRTNNTPVTSNTVDFGSFSGASNSSYISLRGSVNFGGKTGTQFNANVLASSNNDAKGIFTVTKQSASVTKIFRNGTSIVSGNSGGAPSSGDMYIGTINFNGPYTNGYSNQQLTQSMMHTGFSDAQIALLHSRLDTFENALGRKTW